VKLRSTERANGGVPASSMADIAFLLIIFFLTTAVSVSTGLLPGSLQQGQGGPPLEQGAVLHLVIDQAGNLKADGQDLPPRDLESWLGKHRKSLALIQAGGTTAWKHIGPVLATLRKAGIERYAFEDE